MAFIGGVRGGNAKPYDKRTRHDGKIPLELRSPVRHLVKDGIIVAKIKVDDPVPDALATAGALSWTEQAEEIRRLNSILLSRIANDIERGKTDSEAINAFVRVSETAKKWTIEERNSPTEIDPTTLTTEQLKKLAK